MPLFVFFLLALTLTGSTVAVSAPASPYVTPGVSFNPTVAASEVPRQMANVYQLPLRPLDSSVAPWGANVSKVDNDRELQDDGVYRLSINDHRSFPKPHQPSSTGLV
ncbi:hypothetical protein NUU61_004014 [Penicillium alfredii]|uniref:Uncharacterized protein n=1 Tax=Penicillium alfredii TaxID=1506179 RepID=A0A9W9KE81_9EURO|nr:uncharacterized protein NUU61_004014 [Penicillium alfredii]KAJ5101792.1 hypothetical protein NUU61_004014 [Penicillium alfredii]